MRTTLAVAGSTLVALLASTAALPLPLVPWTVTGTETYEGVPVLVTSDVEIASGGHLRLLGANVTVISTGAAPVDIVVRDGGTLELGPGADAITGDVGPARVDAPFEAYEVFVEPGGTLWVDGAVVSRANWEIATSDATMRNATVRLTEGPILVTGGHLQVRFARLEGSPTDLLRVEGGSATVLDSLLHEAAGVGMAAGPGTVVEAKRVILSHLSGYGLLVDRAEARLVDSIIEHTSDYGIRVAGGSAQILGTSVDAHCGAFVTGGGSLLVEGSEITFDENGVHAQYSGPIIIRGTTLTGGDRALTLSASTGIVEDSTFAGTGIGVLVAGSTATLSRTVFVANEGGIDVLPEDVYGPSSVVVHDSEFVENGDFGLRNLQTTTVDARWNWWGNGAGPNAVGADAALGPAALSPWLTSPP